MMETPDKRLVLSILQELTVAALDLFDPHFPMTPFLERVAERMGCLAVLVLGEPNHGPRRLLDAAGLSASARALPLDTDALPYPELSRRIIPWYCSLDVGGPSKHSTRLAPPAWSPREKRQVTSDGRASSG